MNRFVLLALAVSIACFGQRTPEVFESDAGPIKITPIRHASLMIEAGGNIIHVDPWSQGNYDGLPPADVILITDIHSDHMDPQAILRISKENTVIFAPEAVAKTVTKASVIRNGETKTFGKWTIEAVPMYNLTRGPSAGQLYHDKGRGNGYVITFGKKRIYIAGDTEGTPEMKALQNIDVAFVPMNLPYTMTPQEAATAVRAFHPRVVFPYHYRESDTAAFAAALQGSGIDVRRRNWYY